MKTPKDYLQLPYARTVIPTEPNGFHAEILEFPGCFAQGDSLEEAYSNLENAAESWIESCQAQGHEVPQPSSSVSYSGRIVLRLPRSIHRQAAKLAARDETSLNTYLVSAVAAKVGAEDQYNVLTRRMEQRLVQAIYHGYYDVARTEAKQRIQPVRFEKFDTTTSPAGILAKLGR
jgi:antitoxin HicB